MSRKKNKQNKKQTHKTTAPRDSVSKSVKKQSTFTPWRFGRRYEITPDGQKILHKRKIVLEGKLKKFLLISFFVVVGILICGSLTILALNRLNREAEDRALVEAAHNATPVSLVGITAEGKQLIDDTGKYNVFMANGGAGAAETYDSIITTADASVLAERDQIDPSGIIDVPREDDSGTSVTTAYAYGGSGLSEQPGQQ